MKSLRIIGCLCVMLALCCCGKVNNKVHEYKAALQAGDIKQANALYKELKGSDLSTDQMAEVKKIEELYYEDALDEYIKEYEKLMKKGKYEKAFDMITEVDEDDYTLKQKNKILEIAIQYGSSASNLNDFITKLNVGTVPQTAKTQITANMPATPAVAPTPKANRASSNYNNTLRAVAMKDDYSWLICDIPLSDSDLYGLSKSQLRILRNTIYARHGRRFKSPDLQRYFSQFSWYYPTVNEVYDYQLSSTEKHNIRLIQKYE